MAAGIGLWPSDELEAAYPFARRVGGKLEPLWQVRAEKLGLATADDAVRLSRLLPQLEGAISALERLDSRLVSAKVEELSAGDRDRVRQAWWQVFEPILAIDELKARYRAWYGLDYLKQRRLHARGFALSFAGLCAQVDSGLRLLEVLAGKKLLQTLFDEAMPSFGLPAHTLSGLRGRLGRARDLFLVPLGCDWYERWIEREMKEDSELGSFVGLLAPLRQRARSRVLTPTSSGLKNKIETLEAELARRWFPLQKSFAEWAGDTRFTAQERRLISDAQLVELKTKLEPGDIIVERRNWYLSNVGLPGFWPHAALYAGTREQLASLAADLPSRLEQKSFDGWKELGTRDAEGHERTVLEAVSEGVVTSSVEHSCGADYVAVLRPRVSKEAKASAIERALGYFGRPYDFNFDFATDDQVVCSELVVKAYETGEGGQPLVKVPYVEILGRRAAPPTEFVRTFRDELGKPDAQFEFVHFLDGREEQRAAVVASAEALAATCERPKWDIIQP
ncbi:MAG TPA: YiiX/YebB-like N1pC/P60 family cysteine hydrolase [Polyangiaceae bacterium]|nr:YiiX/YebB-like N1pC/P60 family cysteine hydrolase [Polyangiaceae bacterium]